MNIRPLWERTCPRASGFGAHRIADKSAPTVPGDLAGETAAPHPVGPGLSRPTAVGSGTRCAKRQEPSRLKPLLQKPASQRGMTLVELIITIVIVGIAATALFSAMASITGRSADPMLRQQSLAIAEGYLEEILLQDYASATDPCTGRACFNDVRDYHDLDDRPPRDMNDNVIPGLDNYRVEVEIAARSLADGLGPVGQKVPALHIRVTVTDPAGGTLSLDGYRTDY